jgi:hypothetical protein
MDPDLRALADAMDELALFLEQRREFHWASWVADDAKRVRGSDGDGVIHFLQAFGGMGGLNDLVFDPVNKNAPSREEAATLTAEYSRLRNRAWSLADRLRDEAQPSPTSRRADR